MIHIATVHWGSDRWIGVQLRHFERHITQPFRVYASVDRIDPIPDKFYFASALGEEIRGDKPNPYEKFGADGLHGVKLNVLAQKIADEADPDDLLVFIDGDAFPIAPFDPVASALLASHPLAAIRRDENVGDPQPHPSFCVTRVGFWQQIGGDWTRGHNWINAEGETITDWGGKVMKALEDRGIEWLPILRSNRRNLHPILYGVYGDLVYHHGAGFRAPMTRRDVTRLAQDESVREDLRRIRRGDTPEKGPEFQEFSRQAVAVRDQNKSMSEFVFQRILKSDDFVRELFSP
jgi:hypothetical protein